MEEKHIQKLEETAAEMKINAAENYIWYFEILVEKRNVELVFWLVGFGLRTVCYIFFFNWRMVMYKKLVR